MSFPTARELDSLADRIGYNLHPSMGTGYVRNKIQDMVFSEFPSVHAVDRGAIAHKMLSRLRADHDRERAFEFQKSAQAQSLQCGVESASEAYNNQVVKMLRGDREKALREKLAVADNGIVAVALEGAKKGELVKVATQGVVSVKAAPQTLADFANQRYKVPYYITADIPAKPEPPKNCHKDSAKSKPFRWGPVFSTVSFIATVVAAVVGALNFWNHLPLTP